MDRYILFLPLFGLVDVQRRFLTCQNVVQCQVVFSVIFLCIFHGILCYLTIPTYGFVGAVWCNIISTLLYVLALHFYIMFFQPHLPQTFQCFECIYVYMYIYVHIYISWTWKYAIRWKEDVGSNMVPTQLELTSPQSNGPLHSEEEGEDEEEEEAQGEEEEEEEERERENDKHSKDKDKDKTGLNSTKTTTITTDELEKSFVLEKFVGMKGYTILALAGIGTQCNEWWSWEANALLVGLLGTNVLAAHSIYILVVTFAFMLPFGFSTALSARLGHLIGSQQYRLAKQVAICGWCVPLFTTSTITVTIFVARHQIARLFTPDPAVISISESVAPFAAIFILFDAYQGIAQGILRGLSLQTKAVE
ncbi:hypothetical protein RFI_10421 [Reticulomyxa filosa]|uniref:Uncharacterized protein n=1 Tax=Reticulomyxa filosa TaxID=46433 RepID=X6NLC5_RETFI|nr:hypothetical protein RFI_10421 [Reticulomyxa filosa]|eukprot:ETO26713.1 hypothetical protein RFI_10421 [Reticulomyxa filosa]